MCAAEIVWDCARTGVAVTTLAVLLTCCARTASPVALGAGVVAVCGLDSTCVAAAVIVVVAASMTLEIDGWVRASTLGGTPVAVDGSATLGDACVETVGSCCTGGSGKCVGSGEGANVVARTGDKLMSSGTGRPRKPSIGRFEPVHTWFFFGCPHTPHL